MAEYSYDQPEADFTSDEFNGDDESDFAAVGEATTVAEAKSKALEALRRLVPVVNERDVRYIVVEEGSRGGLFGRGRQLAQVEAHLYEDDHDNDLEASELEPGGDGEYLHEFLVNVLGLMEIEAEVAVTESDEAIRANVSGNDLGLLIGRHGTTIDALQSIAAIALNGRRHLRRQVIIDAEGYRERRKAILTLLADRTASKVVRDGKRVTLQPMSAAERKVIHLHLKAHPRVETASEGSEPFRAVVISRRQPT